MENIPLFPRAVRLILYAGGTIGALASVPTIVAHARQAAAPMMGDDASATDSAGPKALTHKSPGSISIQPIGPQTESHRQEELARLRAKLASTQPAR